MLQEGKVENYMEKIANYEMDIAEIHKNIDECIKLLKIDGKNTKSKVQKILEDTLTNILKPYEVKNYDSTRKEN